MVETGSALLRPDDLPAFNLLAETIGPKDFPGLCDIYRPVCLSRSSSIWGAGWPKAFYEVSRAYAIQVVVLATGELMLPFQRCAFLQGLRIHGFDSVNMPYHRFNTILSTSSTDSHIIIAM